MRFSAVVMPMLACWAMSILPASAWDSGFFAGRHSTHSRLTGYAVDAIGARCPEAALHRQALLDGANRELHELPVRGVAYGHDLDALRIRHLGTNEGTRDIDGWWEEAAAAYRRGDRLAAWFIVGVMLHMIADMGVPAHAHRVYHQARPFELDGFEVMGFLRWQPSLAGPLRRDPKYREPWRYYAFSRDWARADAPGYRHPFPGFWVFANANQKELVRRRQGRTALVVTWALRSACEAFSRQ